MFVILMKFVKKYIDKQMFGRYNADKKQMFVPYVR